MKNYLYLVLVVFLFVQCSTESSKRTTISLKGSWQIAQSVIDQIPEKFEREIPVPGLVDLALPAFDSVGVKTQIRNYFWYKTTFNTNAEDSQIAILKFHKVKYGLKAWINGFEIGESMLNFTPAKFQVKEFLREGENELIVRVFATPDMLPDSIVWGHDFEKLKYIPGIYDDVQLILTNPPFIKNVQLVPQIEESKIDVLCWLEGTKQKNQILNYKITEVKGGAVVAKGKVTKELEKIDGEDGAQFSIEIPGAKLWSPENPFLYELEIQTEEDSYKSNFGMRNFRFNPETKRAELNNALYYLRGTNICIFRFSEDAVRNDLIWNKEWVRGLYRKMKDLHYNSFRFCIGFPPGFWYDLADEMGFVVQDEYPIWYGARPEMFPTTWTATELAFEYSEWMKERWNHACVLTWDAQNESLTDLTGEALELVRHLDRSNRPWDNGYSPPMRESDPIETHPYRLQNFLGKRPGVQGPLFDYFTEKLIPDNGPSELYPPEDGGIYPNPIIINEYPFYWLNRDGLPTGLTKYIYQNIFQEELSKEAYQLTHAQVVAKLTQYWRAYRTSAGVQHFVMLGYSRGQNEKDYTSDNFVDVANLKLEPQFEKYMKSAMYPVCILIDRWEEWFCKETQIEIPVKLINDNPESWKNRVTFQLKKGEDILSQLEKEIEIPGYGSFDFTETIDRPKEFGFYTVLVSFEENGETIFSEYNFEVRKTEVKQYESPSKWVDKQFIHAKENG